MSLLQKTAEPLSTLARTLVSALLGLKPLPGHLNRLTPLLLYLRTLIVCTAAHRSYQNRQQDRAKIQLAVFLILRIISERPDFEYLQRADFREELLERLDNEVVRLHKSGGIDRGQRRGVVRELKRRFVDCDDIFESAAKRQKAEDQNASKR
jgi:hypothetical protein